MRINNTGTYEYCRWATKNNRNNGLGIRDLGPAQWFQRELAPMRIDILKGQLPDTCADCQKMESHGKISGRQKQLLKIGVKEQSFVPALRSSPWWWVLERSWHANGHTEQLPQDWQIDLGNFCNSACVFCTPHSSSRLASEHFKLGLIDSLPPRSWADDAVLLDRLMQDIVKTPNLRYLHFIGGETLITPAFKVILQRLIEHGLQSIIAIGLTTNLTVWRQDIVELLQKFSTVNLGMSIECLHPVNDYVRYPSNINDIKTTMSRWLHVADSMGWLAQIRITPTVLTVLHIDTIYRYALEHTVAVESCNFLDEPKFMRASVLPQQYRDAALEKLMNLDFGSTGHNKIINTRDPHQHRAQLQQDCASYIDYLTNAPDESHRLPSLVQYLQKLESTRGNRIIDYVPEYQELFRSAGYR